MANNILVRRLSLVTRGVFGEFSIDLRRTNDFSVFVRCAAVGDVAPAPKRSLFLNWPTNFDHILALDSRNHVRKGGIIRECLCLSAQRGGMEGRNNMNVTAVEFGTDVYANSISSDDVLITASQGRVGTSGRRELIMGNRNVQSNINGSELKGERGQAS
jgi:hypothetical protein